MPARAFPVTPALRRLAALAALAAAAAAGRADPVEPEGQAMENSLLQIMVTHQEFDNTSPWQKEKPAGRFGYGIAVDRDRLLVPETVMRNGTLVEVRRSMRAEKHAAAVDVADYQTGLAIVRVDGALGDGLTPVPIATNVPRDAALEIVQFDENAALQRGAASVLKIAVASLPQSPSAALTYTLQTELNVNGAGAPVFWRGALAGIVVNYDRGTRTATMLPFVSIHRFRDDASKPPYEGVPAAGFVWTALVDPAKRAYLRAPPGDQGVVVTDVLPGSGAADALRPGDVILEWDGRRIDNLGFYDDLVFGRVLLPFLITGRRAPGETVPVRLIRNREPAEVQVRLARRGDADNLIPENIEGVQPEYMAEAGYIVFELSGEYLRAQGPKWELAVNPRLVHLYMSRAQKPDTPGERVVILSRVLPDPINIGTHQFRDQNVTHINGEAIRNMKDVFRVVDRDGGLRRLTLQGIGVDIVIDEAELPRANERISRLYSIPRLQHRNQRSVTSRD